MGKIIIDTKTNDIMADFRDQICNLKQGNRDIKIVNLIEQLFPDEIMIVVSEGGRDKVTKVSMFYVNPKTVDRYIIGEFNGLYSFKPIFLSDSFGLYGIALQICDKFNSSTQFCFFKDNTQNRFTIDFETKKIIFI